ncbi:MAG: glycosyltransferase family 2 protein [Planctomycetota bacterium]
MTPLTVTVITFNEEKNIRECLESVSWVPNIVVVDSQSTDRTVAIAREFTEHVVVTDWPGHVEQKNRAVDLAPTDWVLSIDADERVTPEMRAEIEAALATEPTCAGFSFPRRTWHLGRWILHGGWYPDRKLRLFDRRRARWGGTNPHDHVNANGPVEARFGDILHYTYRDLRHHLEVIDFFTDIAARGRESKRRWLLPRLVFGPPFKFCKMYWVKRGYRDGFAGFIIAALGALYVFLKDAKLWERGELRRRGLDPDRQPRYTRGPEYRPPRSW